MQFHVTFTEAAFKHERNFQMQFEFLGFAVRASNEVDMLRSIKTKLKHLLQI